MAELLAIFLSVTNWLYKIFLDIDVSILVSNGVWISDKTILINFRYVACFCSAAHRNILIKRFPLSSLVSVSPGPIFPEISNKDYSWEFGI